jgi:hypothetical protein
VNHIHAPRRPWWAGTAGWVIPSAAVALFIAGLFVYYEATSTDTASAPLDLDRGEAVQSDNESAPQALSADTPCAQLVGHTTAEVLAAGSCAGAEDIVLLGFANLACADGRVLHWNDEGWGYADGNWQAHTSPDLVPPEPDYSTCSGG